VQISHGGYQANTFAGGAMRCQECAESVHCIKNLHDVYTLLPATSPASQGLSLSLDVERYAALTLASPSGMAVCPLPLQLREIHMPTNENQHRLFRSRFLAL